MSISNRFIVVVAIFHALILIGFGHTGAVVGWTILFAPEFMTNPSIVDLILIRADKLPAIGTLSLLGYLFLIIACFNRGKSKNVFYLFSMIFLWWSVAYLIVLNTAWGMVNSHPLFYTPFLLISLAPLYWKGIKSQVSVWLKN
jgi:hypothetical protein